MPIGNGCDNFCSYCVVPYARGREVYRPAGEILDEVKDLVKQGYREIILIAQNVNSYKSEEPPLNFPLCKGENVSLLTKEGRFNFADLLNMVNQIPGDFWIRFFTSHPKDMSDQLIKVLAKCEKVCHQIHLPAQVGDDGVLKRMNRGYTVSDYVKLIKKIKNILNDQIPMANDQTNFKLQIPNSKQFSNFRLIPPEAKSTSLLRQAVWQLPVSITTDIIVGFPGETKKQFDRTAELMRRVKFDMAYIAKYSPRPGTSAFKLADNVSRKEKVKRAKQLDRILRQTALVNNKKYLGKTVEVLVESKTKAGEWFGKTATGKDIRFSADSEALKAGDFIKVKVTRAKEFCLSGAAAKKYKGVRFGN
ncbi:hypothetical protein A3H09_03280 [Candidatus Falkowbacteria bacterium RIFCSPLOWO2_12_FULL_45_13]|uniref:tRNA-2-methylthio-N(6)-dimethylallyladenosine synthase n=1 Tax=Candidatus Falkowbacteria bacterium RIFCSPLOWO2_12_FULL_45_13 TaxID=1797991 RepID=A0A1F5SZH4_9BACT|nr:MAG: hypothetical protein A3H09_03280 [Candidatus Falkowbacteria bacterium RIFCSPLOWO2_12_FULL_45_13]